MHAAWTTPTTMTRGIEKRVRNPYLRDILEYFIKYVGSSAEDAPGFMNLMPNIQLEFGLWYVRGGLYELARAFEQPTARRLACAFISTSGSSRSPNRASE